MEAKVSFEMSNVLHGIIAQNIQVFITHRWEKIKSYKVVILYVKARLIRILKDSYLL
jgi:hypothetical protein